MRNFNEIFRKDLAYDNIKSYEKAGLYPLSGRYIFEKTAEGVKLIPQPFLCEKGYIRVDKYIQ